MVLIFSALIAIGCGDAFAQRRINHVKPPTSTVLKKKEVKKEEFDKSRLVEAFDAHGNKILIDTVAGTEYVDSTALEKPVGNIYPLLHAVTIGVDVWDPVMRLLGTQYGGIGFWGELSLHNRFKPVFELGVSSADISPDGMNYTFKSGLAPYFKIGGSYNIFYNSNPDYQLLFGLRYGFSPFSFKVVDITPNTDYWHTPVFEVPSQSTTAGYWEFVASIKVKIWKNISMGWSFRYHSILHGGKGKYGESMYVPGFGKRGTSIAGGFSIMYTLPLNKKTVSAVNTMTESE